jgi:hypothetical protein
MKPEEYLETLEPARKEVLNAIRKLVLKHDKKVVEVVSSLMSKQMLIYNCDGHFKYALAATKTGMTFHSLVMYGYPELHAKYVKLLPKAKFQKGCINFIKPEQMPLEVVDEMMKDFAKCEFPPKQFAKSMNKKAATRG